ncbi:glycogen debranching protein [Pseudonocardia sp. S2-4]|uniref:Glycogen debranching protein n=1 Tax=Pseudonocardia humida TaxID=2800819 RepID=A0ABT0ZS42_9PSEU|nr:glycogen debranching protein [Pseudonocardia humida]
MDGPALDVAVLRRAAVEVLRRNDLGTATVAAPGLYPHQWSWDSAFIAIGLSRIDVPRAAAELRSLLGAQWSTGMIPHIVFSPGAADYFPGPDRWGTDDAPARPADRRTSGICQPPVHAIAVRHILDRGREEGGAVQEAAEVFAAETFDALLAWHRWLVRARDPDGVGLVEIHHSWESGFDNSPRWDGPYSRVVPGPVAPFTRRDTTHVEDAAQRPTDEEYRRYLWLVDQMRAVGFEDDRVRESIDFRVRDVFVSAILAAAAEVLADIGDDLGRDAEAAEQRAVARRFRAGVAATVDPATGLARDWDVLADQWVAPLTVAGFAPLVAGGDPGLLTRQRSLLLGDQWMGHPALRFPLPPSTSPVSPDFRRRTYWRGPVWPFLNLLLGWASLRDSAWDLRWVLRDASLDQLADLTFAEYYEPITGEALGSRNQSWTAAAALEWLA